MKRVIFCWELGGNYGHITSFIGLAQAFKARGCELVFVLRDLKYAHLLGEGVSCVQAPVPKSVPVKRDAYSYTGILASIGYLNCNVLTDYVDSWRRLLLDHQADLVIVDHAPTPILAARTLAIPVAAIGTGFVIPPFVDAQYPWFQSQQFEPVADLDNKVLSSINYAVTRLGGIGLNNLGDIFADTTRFLCTLPELDHYGIRSCIDYWGPLFSADQGIEPRWPDVSGARIFAYLTPKLANLEQVVTALAQSPGAKLLHLPGATEEQCQAWSNPSLKIEAQPVNMSQVLDVVDMVVSQGGMGVSSQCVLAGVRHVIIPTQMEQAMLARRLSAMGLAYVAGVGAAVEEYEALFSKALACELLSQNSRLLAKKYKGFAQKEQVEAMVEGMLDLLLPDGE